METDRHIWRVWAGTLHRWGAQDAAAVLLEACGPLTVIGAQFVYLGQPLLKGFAADESLSALAAMLENKTETRAFVNLLREANQQ